MNIHSPAAKQLCRIDQTIFRLLYYLFFAFGVLALGYATYAVVDARVYQTVEESKIPAMRHNQEARVIAEGDVIGEMVIPRLEMKAVFVQGDSSRILRRAVGHIMETSLPGETGNVVLTGHRDSFFRPLRNIRHGDAITLKTPEGDFQYEVESTAVVAPTDVGVLRPSAEPTLTLITCFPFYYIGPAPKRFIVVARQVGRLPVRSGADGAYLPF